MNKLILTLICALPFAVSAQPTSKTVEAGSFADGRKITAIEFTPGSEIIETNPDLSRQMLLVVLNQQYKVGDYVTGRPVRQLAMYDLKAGSLLWIREAPLYDYSGFMYSKNYFVCGAPGLGICYNKKDGEERWRCDTKLMLVNDTAGVAISVFGKGYDLRTGEERWDRQFLLDGWRNHVNINGQTIAVLGSSGLEYIHLSDGSGWTFEGADGHNSLPEFKDYTSNLLLRNHKMYFATGRHMFCVDTTGSIVWQRDLPDKKGCRSLILFNKDSNRVAMVSFGTNHIGYRAGAAYLAAWHANDGEPAYLQMLEGRDVIKGLYIDSVATVIAGARHVHAYDINNGSKIAAVKIQGSSFSNYNVPVDRIYTAGVDSNSFRDECDAFAGHSFWMNPRDSSILHADQNLRPANTIAADNWWRLYKHTPDFDLVRQHGVSVMLRNGKRFATLDISNATVVGNKIVGVTKNYFRVIDMSGWFKQGSAESGEQ